jgi:hypothetical protein
MTGDLKNIDAAILEVQVFECAMLGGAPAQLAVTLLDMRNDAIEVSKTVRAHGAQAFGMLFFKSASPRCPQKAVIWEKFEDGLQVTAADEERYLLDKALNALCIQVVEAFLTETAKKDPRYAWLARPQLH